MSEKEEEGEDKWFELERCITTTLDDMLLLLVSLTSESVTISKLRCLSIGEFSSIRQVVISLNKNSSL